MATTHSSAIMVTPYLKPSVAKWLDSYEGVPEWVGPAEPSIISIPERSWRARANDLFETAGKMVPGVALAIGLAVGGSALASWIGIEILGFTRSPISAILMAVLLGLAIRNLIGLPTVYDPGLRLCLKRILRVGVALLGIRMTMAAAGTIGLMALPLVVICITSALCLVTWFSRLLGLPKRLGLLIAVGTSICGNSAIVATGPVIDAEDDEMSYAVGCITVFGLLALLVYPYLSHWIFAGDPFMAGLFLGTSIHDTSQVAGAGLMYLQQHGDREALEVATVTKLVRNLCMLVVIPLMAMMYRREAVEGLSKGSAKGKPKWRQLVPLFVFGFVGMTVLRTVGDLSQPALGFLSKAQWSSFIGTTTSTANWCLAIAMAAVGLGTNISRLKKLGLKPLAAGMFAALLVGCLSAGLILALRPLFTGMSS